MPEHLGRLAWSRDHLLWHQQESLRRLVQVAKTQSPWHRTRLSDVDPTNLELSDLARLPVMNKSDVMEHWDQVLTVEGIDRARCEEFVEAQEGFDYLDDTGRQVFASGGSSGRRGLYLWDEDFFVTTAATAFRFQHRDRLESGEVAAPSRRAVVTVGKPPHASTPLFATNVDPGERVALCSVLLPFSELTTAVAEVRPDHLIGYPSVIHRLAEAQAEGRLHIAPRRVSTNSEPLLPEARAAFEQVWGAVVNNMWGSTEVGMHAIACDRSEGMHLCEDVVLVERVDASNRPVNDQSPADRLLVTSLSNATFPFLRYQMDDSITLVDRPCPCGSSLRLVADVAGRRDDDFSYGGSLKVPAAALRDVLGSIASIQEYQVHQTPRGVRICVVGSVAEPASLADALTASLRRFGVDQPVVDIEVVPSLDRDARTGKLRRFVPLPEGA